MAEKRDPKPQDDFDLESKDLFFGGTSASPRKESKSLPTEEELQEDVLKPLEVQIVADSEKGPPMVSPQGRAPAFHPLAQSSPRVIRMESEDGTVEEFKMNTPVIRRSKSLLLRRVTSELACSSPHLHMCSPVPARRRRLNENKSSLQRVKSEDRISEGSKESSSGRESVSIETDEEAGNRLESLQTEEQDSDCTRPEAACAPSSSSTVSAELDDSVSAVVCIPFEKLLVRQESELFEHLSKGSEQAQMDTGKSEDTQKEFKINRRRSLKRQMDSVEDNDSHQQKRQRSRSKAAVGPEPSGVHPEELRIKSAVEKLTHHGGDVIGDGTVPYALPCFRGKKEELMFISVDTLAELLRGSFEDVIDTFEVIDCRYPYEYEGGHVSGALNMYKADSIQEIMSWKLRNEDGAENTDKRMVLIFHCEFSSQRGPAMMRLLRSTDRKHNSHCYPYLCHPEIYLLSGGYKAFFEKYPELCDPQAYIPMCHSAYQKELRMFRSKATTWHGKSIVGSTCRSIIL